MTAVPVAGRTDATLVRAGRAAAGSLAACLAVVFLIGIGLWAREGEATVALWAMPETWSQAQLADVAESAGLRVAWLLTFFIVLELLPAAPGVVAAFLVLRGAATWSRVYLGVVLALFGTMNGAVPTVYREVLGGAAGEAGYALQGLAWVALFPLAYVFPDGRFAPRWTRWAACGWATYLPFTLVLSLLGREDPESLAQTAPLLVLGATAAYAAVHRYRKVSAPEQRRQSRGLMAAFVLFLLIAVIVNLTPFGEVMRETSGRGLAVYAATMSVSYLVVALIPAAIAVAILRFRLYDVDVWVNRALVNGLLTGLVAASYAVLAVLGALFWRSHDLTVPLVVAALLVAAFQPLHSRVQRAVDRYVYGRRKEPYAVLAELGRQLEAVVPPGQVLETLVRQVGTALKLPHVSASLSTTGSASATWPEPAGPVPNGLRENFPLHWQDEDLGVLTVVAAPGDGLSAADRDLLDGLARQAGAAVWAATLNDDLRRSRERIVVAREDERRRLQRDLHDGLGPTLASLYQRVDAARYLLAQDPDAADRLLRDVGDQTRAVIGDIRELVRALRPPELDQLGLVGAVEAAASRFGGLNVTVTGQGLRPLPAVVEIAAYRIAMEALTNVARHAAAGTAAVTLQVTGDHLKVEVVDDGRGLPVVVRPGTGLRSLRERADELSGTCEVTRLPGAGTRVRAVLPMRGEE